MLGHRPHVIRTRDPFDKNNDRSMTGEPIFGTHRRGGQPKAAETKADPPSLLIPTLGIIPSLMELVG